MSPPEIARSRGIRVSKILAWIERGELEAVNFAERPGGRPRWRISAEAIRAFEQARSSRLGLAPLSAPRRQANPNITEFF